MLSAQDNELITRVGLGTPMGNLMRQYWIPAIRSDELPSPDCPPVGWPSGRPADCLRALSSISPGSGLGSRDTSPGRQSRSTPSMSDDGGAGGGLAMGSS